MHPAQEKGRHETHSRGTTLSLSALFFKGTWGGDGRASSCLCLSCPGWGYPSQGLQTHRPGRNNPADLKAPLVGLFLGGQKPKQQLPGPERHTSGFVSSSLDPPTPLVCTVARLIFLFPTQGAHTKPSQLGSHLPPGATEDFFGLHGTKSQPTGRNHSPCITLTWRLVCFIFCGRVFYSPGISANPKVQ